MMLVIDMFGERLKKLRQNVGLSQQELADILNVSKSCICQYEKNSRIPSIEILIGISNYFDTTIDYLLGNVVHIQRNKVGISSLSLEEIDLIKKIRKHNINIKSLIDYVE